MMQHKNKLKDGLEYDVIFYRKMYCYLKNNHSLIKFAKNKINRRNRFNSKLQINNELNLDFQLQEELWNNIDKYDGL